jgi:hypothetical protein
MSVPAAQRAVAFRAVDRNVNTSKRLSREDVDRGPADLGPVAARDLRTQVWAKNHEESEALH